MAKEAINVDDFRVLAKRKLPRAIYDFYAGGADDEWTLKENVAAFQRIRLRPRVLVDVSNVNLSTKILGFKTSAPIMIAPSARHNLAYSEGEVATAKAAAASDIIMVLSFSCSSTVEEVAKSCDAVRFFQLYVFKQRNITEILVQRAVKSGYNALVLTVDTPKLGNREADTRNKLVVPSLKNFEGLLLVDKDTEKGTSHASFAAQTIDASFTWKDIAWLKSLTSLPILLKGILTAEDVELAIQGGTDGIIVSNHGGRQLDYVAPAIEALEEVVLAAKGRVPVFFDGGIRRGTDIFKALALGAQAVLIGRPIIFGLAADGQSGVEKVLKILKNELELAMSLCGCASVEDIKRSHVESHLQRLHSLL